MDEKMLKSVINQVCQRFPEMRGVKPKVRTQRSPQANNSSLNSKYTLTFHTHAKTENNKLLSRWVRVVVTNQGKILKITTSR